MQQVNLTKSMSDDSDCLSQSTQQDVLTALLMWGIAEEDTLPGMRLPRDTRTEDATEDIVFREGLAGDMGGASGQPSLCCGRSRVSSLREAGPVDGASTHAACALASWWKSVSGVRRVGHALLRQSEQLQSVLELFSAESRGFEDLLPKIQDKSLILTVSAMLSAIGRGGHTSGNGSPGSQQGARKLLSALMIKKHPSEVVTDDAGAPLEAPDARLLHAAATLAIDSTSAMIKSLEAFSSGEQGSMALFAFRLGTFRFALRFLDSALATMQSHRAHHIAANFLGSYAEAYRNLKDAERAEDEALIETAKRSLDKVKAGIATVVGRDKADKHCQRVETAVLAEEPYVVITPGGGAAGSTELRVMIPSSSPRSTRSSSAGTGVARAMSSPPRDASVGGGAAAGTNSPRPRLPEGGGATGGELGDLDVLAIPVPAALSGLLRNEQLAHEILLNPDFKLADTAKQEKELESRVPGLAEFKERMDRMFWDRLVLALTRPEEERIEDIQAGAVVQIRPGGNAFFAARVDAVHPNGTVEVTYVVDGQRDRRPLADVRLKSWPLDYAPLLSLLDDVREKLVELTPNRKDLADELKGNLDTELLGQMAANGALDAKSIRAALTFIVQRVLALQAPARAEETLAWFQGLESRVEECMQPHGQDEFSPAFVALLPSTFKTIFERIDETRLDIANAHVEMLRPFLAKYGVAYERFKFIERCRSGEVTLANTATWLKDVVAAAEDAAGTQQLLTSSAAQKRLITDGVLHLVRLPVRLDTPAAQLPEPLAMDAHRLAEVRDDADRVTLTLVYSTLLRQFLVQQRVPVSAEAMGAVESRLYTILSQDEGLRLTHLVDEVTSSAKRMFADAGSSMNSEQEGMLGGVLSNAARMDSPIFSLLFSRVCEIVGAVMGGDVTQTEDLIRRYGCSSFHEALQRTGTRLRRVCEHTLAVHGEIYVRVLKQTLSSA